MQKGIYFALALTVAGAIAVATRAEPAKQEWESSEHGQMLRRVLPPGPKPKDLPEADSTGARLLTKYCVQCHYLASPAMHTAEVWPTVIARMDRRMRGEGNIGAAMKDLMQGVSSMDGDERVVLTSYLKKHGQKTIDRRRFPDLDSSEGRAFAEACDQCHMLPDPGRHTASEWPEVVERMQKNLRWVGVIAATKNERNSQRLKVDQILSFLQRNSRQP